MEDVTKVVEEINEAIFHSENSEHEYVWYLEHVKTPIGDYIEFYGQRLWDSDNDYREYVYDEVNDVETEEREDLKSYLIHQMSLVSKVRQSPIWLKV